MGMSCQKGQIGKVANFKMSKFELMKLEGRLIRRERGGGASTPSHSVKTIPLIQNGMLPIKN